MGVAGVATDGSLETGCKKELTLPAIAGSTKELTVFCKEARYVSIEP